MINFVVGVVIGSIVGVTTMCLIIVGREEENGNKGS